MNDRLSREQRSALMSRIRSKDTAPELVVRRTLHALGFRYRLHARELPGKPDIVFRKRRKAIFVHGCYWHGHGCRRGGSGPKSNTAYWKPKIEKNQARDERNQLALVGAGWEVMVVWECEISVRDELSQRLQAFVLGA